jgi:death-on-curing protein
MTTTAPPYPPQLTVARAHDLHAAALAHAGGSPGVRDEGLVEASVGGALTAASYDERERDDDPVDSMVLAAYLLCYLARNHAFLDGNKRVAWLALEDQLRSIGVRVIASADEAETLVLDVVAKKLEADDVVEWIATRLVAYEPSRA